MGNRNRSRNGASAWWPAPRYRVWVALAGVGIVALVVAFLSLRSDNDAGTASASRFTSAYTFSTNDLHALSFDPATPGRLVFGHHGGVMSSTDTGKTWSDLVERENFDGMNLVFDPSDSQTLYLAGHNVFSRSDDGGATWNTISHNLPGLDLHAFGASAAAPGRFYAFAMGKGIFVSAEGASAWSPLWSGAPQGTNSIVALNDGPLLVGSSDKGILRSDDDGQTWTPSGSGIETGVIWTLRAEPASGRVYAGTSSGLFVSTDGGRSWSATSLDDVQVVVVGVNPADAEDVMAIDGSGRLYRSTDGGASWGS